MSRPRPYIPLSVRAQVAERQVIESFGKAVAETIRGATSTWSDQLHYLLKQLGFEKPQLDHDPALILRPYVDGYYSPAANDPRYLVYREKADHQQKTTGRKPGAERTVTTKGSDIWLKSKFNRLEGRTKPKRKVKIPKRKNPWPKRPFASATKKS